MNRLFNLVMGLVLIAAGIGVLVFLSVRVRFAPVANAQAVPSPSPQSEPSGGLASGESATAGLDASTQGSASAPSSSGVAAPTSAASESPAANSSLETGAASVSFPPRASVTRNTARALEPVAAFMKGNPTAKLMLIGHGDPGMKLREYGDLGRARALVVRRVLLDFRVPVARLMMAPPNVVDGVPEDSERKAGTVEIRVVAKEKGEGHGP